MLLMIEPNNMDWAWSQIALMISSLAKNSSPSRSHRSKIKPFTLSVVRWLPSSGTPWILWTCFLIISAASSGSFS